MTKSKQASLGADLPRILAAYILHAIQKLNAWYWTPPVNRQAAGLTGGQLTQLAKNSSSTPAAWEHAMAEAIARDFPTTEPVLSLSRDMGGISHK